MSRPASPVPHPQHLHLRGRFKFLEEAEVVLEVVTEVIDLPFEHSDALKSHSECESAVFLRVYSAGFEDVRVNHTGTEYFEPTGAFADIAAFAVAYVAAYVNLGRWFGEREVTWPHTYLSIRAEHFTGKEEERLLEVSEGHVFIYVQTLYLMEDAMGGGADRLVSKHPSGADHPYRKLRLFHSTDLYAGSMGTKQNRVDMT